MQSGNKVNSITIIAGVAILILGGILAVLLINNGGESLRELKAPEKEFIYVEGEEYGKSLNFSTSLLDALFSEDSWINYEMVLERFSAFFAINYPEYTSFGLVKDSYKRLGEGKNERIELKMVSNLGTIVGLKIEGINGEAEVTKATLSNSLGEKVYETTIDWSETEQMDGGGQDWTEEELGEDE